jgi:hypothetical protein
VTDSGNTSPTEPATVSEQPVAASATASWTPEPSAQESAVGAAAEHPELIVGGAFIGGLLLATILKRLAR